MMLALVIHPILGPLEVQPFDLTSFVQRLQGIIGADLDSASTEVGNVLFWYTHIWSGAMPPRNDTATKLWHELNPSGRTEPVNGWVHFYGTVVVSGRKDVDLPDDLHLPDDISWAIP